MGAKGLSAQIMSDQIMSDKVRPMEVQWTSNGTNGRPMDSPMDQMRFHFLLTLLPIFIFIFLNLFIYFPEPVH